MIKSFRNEIVLIVALVSLVAMMFFQNCSQVSFTPLETQVEGKGIGTFFKVSLASKYSSCEECDPIPLPGDFLIWKCSSPEVYMSCDTMDAFSTTGLGAERQLLLPSGHYLFQIDSLLNIRNGMWLTVQNSPIDHQILLTF